MKTLRSYLTVLALVVVGTLAGCSSFNKAADISGDIRTSMEQAGLKGVTVSQDRDKGVVTLRRRQGKS